MGCTKSRTKAWTLACFDCAGHGRRARGHRLYRCFSCGGIGRAHLNRGDLHTPHRRHLRHDQSEEWRKWDLAPEAASLQARLKWDRRRRRRGSVAERTLRGLWKAMMDEHVGWSDEHNQDERRAQARSLDL